MKGITLDDAAIVMAEGDTVATALADLEPGREFQVDGRTVTLSEAVAFGHKFALEATAPGEPIRKYGEVVGEATQPIASGEWVHTHNVESTRARPDTDDTDGSREGEQ